MNKVFIVGRLTRDPEHRTTPNGISVTTFSVAVTRRMNREEADFFNVVAWRGLADNCAKYLVKGQQIAVVGELRTRSYEAKDGTKRYVTEIQHRAPALLPAAAAAIRARPPRPRKMSCLHLR